MPPSSIQAKRLMESPSMSLNDNLINKGKFSNNYQAGSIASSTAVSSSKTTSGLAPVSERRYSYGSSTDIGCTSMLGELSDIKEVTCLGILYVAFTFIHFFLFLISV